MRRKAFSGALLGAAPGGEMVMVPEKEVDRSSPVPRKLYKTGEIMAHTGISRQTLHNYTLFGLIREEERTPSGHRLYAEEVFIRLAKINDLKEKLSLREIKEMVEKGRI